MKFLFEIYSWNSPFERTGRRLVDRTDRSDFTAEDLMMQTGLHWLGIGSRECENEQHCKLETISK
jgi:hypothetical protein